MLTDPGLEDFAARAAGSLAAVTDRCRPPDGSRIWELVSASEEPFFLKQHQSPLLHERE